VACLCQEVSTFLQIWQLFDNKLNYNQFFTGENHILSDAFIEEINSLNSTWTAGRNFHPATRNSRLARKHLLRIRLQGFSQLDGIHQQKDAK
jgi:hypothetical protein